MEKTSRLTGKQEGRGRGNERIEQEEGGRGCWPSVQQGPSWAASHRDLRDRRVFPLFLGLGGAEKRAASVSALGSEIPLPSPSMVWQALLPLIPLLPLQSLPPLLLPLSPSLSFPFVLSPSLCLVRAHTLPRGWVTAADLCVCGLAYMGCSWQAMMQGLGQILLQQAQGLSVQAQRNRRNGLTEGCVGRQPSGSWGQECSASGLQLVSDDAKCRSQKTAGMGWGQC